MNSEISPYSILATALPQGMQLPQGTGLVMDAWMDAQAAAICRGEWSGWPSAGGFDLLRDALTATEADDGALWLVDDVKRELRPCFSIGPYSKILLNEIRQPLTSGLISMVFLPRTRFAKRKWGVGASMARMLIRVSVPRRRPWSRSRSFLHRGAGEFFLPFFSR